MKSIERIKKEIKTFKLLKKNSSGWAESIFTERIDTLEWVLNDNEVIG